MTIDRSRLLAQRPSILALSLAITLAAFSLHAMAADRSFHVAPGGNDTGSGSESEPFATVPRAMAAVRQLRQQ
ncbi:MAG: hypothetical protein U1E05_23635, partial [Patescibacteria group bacterium]|nr:hypothetical protein [Patescibacteria group bacterium]